MEILIVTVSIGRRVNNTQELSETYMANFKEVVNSDHNPVKYLAIDPGKSNGICGYDAKYYMVFMLTIKEEDVVTFLNLFEQIETCIIESYRIFPQKARQHIYSDLATPRVIGRVEGWAATNKIELIKQPSRIKTTGYAWAGIKPPPKSDPTNHVMDANVHFIYWAVTHGKINAAHLLKPTTVEGNTL